MTGCRAKATPLCALDDGCVVMVSWVAGGGGGVDTVIVADVVLVSPGEVNCSVRSPSAPEIERSVNVAAPLAFVVAVAVPPNVPPPVAIAAVTVTPAWADASFDPY